MSRTLLVLAAALPLLAGAATDPTLPPAALGGPAASAEALPAPQLQAILRGPAGARAVIGGRSLRAGERRGDLQVLAIRARSVLVERQGQRQELRLAQPILSPSTLSPSR
ncbi:MAG TPA: Type II secretory pathway component [Pseudomonas sp.]|nr:Type II secretory pathway component [Pseudomonas sp.]